MNHHDTLTHILTGRSRALPDEPSADFFNREVRVISVDPGISNAPQIGRTGVIRRISPSRKRYNIRFEDEADTVFINVFPHCLELI